MGFNRTNSFPTLKAAPATPAPVAVKLLCPVISHLSFTGLRFCLLVASHYRLQICVFASLKSDLLCIWDFWLKLWKVINEICMWLKGFVLKSGFIAADTSSDRVTRLCCRRREGATSVMSVPQWSCCCREHMWKAWKGQRMLLVLTFPDLKVVTAVKRLQLYFFHLFGHYPDRIFR